MGSYKGYRGNANKVMADAKVIVDRLSNTRITIRGLCKEYRCAYLTITRAILSRISKERYREIARRKLAHGNDVSRFKKGHIPWTKGRKGIHLSPVTEFRKGHIPNNYKQIGTVYVISDSKGNKYRWIKLSDTGSRQQRRMPYSRYVCLKAGWTIPEGMFPAHLDGDSLNDELSNLCIVDRAENVRIAQARDPGIVQRMRKGASRVNKRRWDIYRKSPKVRQVAEDKRHEKIYKENIIEFRRKVSWYQCKGCGFDSDQPRPPCPKCGHLVFEKIEQLIELAQRRAMSK